MRADTAIRPYAEFDKLCQSSMTEIALYKSHYKEERTCDSLRTLNMFHPLQAKPLRDRIHRLDKGDMHTGFIIEHGGNGKVTAWTSAAAFRKTIGDFAWVNTLLKDIDFKTEQLVLVSWMSSGPPEGELRFRSSNKRGQLVVDFYVDPPKGVRVRGERARVGATIFAIPRGANPIYTPEP